LVPMNIDDPREPLRHQFATPPEQEAGKILRDSYLALRKSFGRTVGRLAPPRQFAVVLADALYRAADESGDVEEARLAAQLGKDLIDIGLGLTPVVGDAVALYEGFFGETLTGRKLLPREQIFALSCAFIGNIRAWQALAGRVSRQVRAIVQRLKPARLLTIPNTSLEEAQLISRFASKYAVKGKLGDQFADVARLKDLPKTEREAFEGTIFKGVYEPGEILFQVQDARRPAGHVGRWFSPVRPVNAQHADEMLNTRRWNNFGEVLRVYVVRERVAGYAGKVAGGEGHQFLLPRDVSLVDVLEEIR